MRGNFHSIAFPFRPPPAAPLDSDEIRSFLFNSELKGIAVESRYVVDTGYGGIGTHIFADKTVPFVGIYKRHI